MSLTDYMRLVFSETHDECISDTVSMVLSMNPFIVYPDSGFRIASEIRPI